jgi:cation:H+ antiporter
MFLFSATAILLVAEPFAHSLKDIGAEFGISEFLLIQWIAPLASESPEMIIAILFVLRLKAQAGLGTLISSKVNQWTLLVATLPLVFSLGAGEFAGLPIDGRQREELFLTAAQSLFAVGVIASLSISRLEAIALLVLFSAQLAIPQSEIRMGFAVAYIVLFVGMIAFRREVRTGLHRALLHVIGRDPDQRGAPKPLD